jgi:hypothetical protein
LVNTDGGRLSQLRTLTADGIPGASIAVDDVLREVERVKSLVVTSFQEALQVAPVTTADLIDSRGNLMQIASPQR